MTEQTEEKRGRGRPRKHPAGQLAALDTDTAATAVQDRVRAAGRTLAFGGALGLAMYARTGNAAVWEVHQLNRLAHETDELLGRPDPETDVVGLVLAAATGRRALEIKAPVTLRQLCALTGYSRGRLRQLAAAGELERTSRQPGERAMDAPIAWASASEFLRRSCK